MKMVTFLILLAAHWIFSQLCVVQCQFTYDMKKLASASNQKRLPVSEIKGQPVKVYVGFYIQSMGNVEATRMSYDADVYLRMSWVDRRLAHSEEMISISDREALHDVWSPDIYFVNAKTAHFQYVTVPNFVLYIERNGTCAYSARVTLNAACNLHLVEYPLDSQICTLQIMSYGHTNTAMNVTWFEEDAIKINDEIDLPEFDITAKEAAYCDASYEYAITAKGFRKGKFSCLLAKIYMKRNIGYHLVQTYIPTGLIVVISWVSFWIDRNAVPARVTLSFTALLTLSTMGAGLRYALPAVSYAKAIDFWFGACMCFIFAALLEFAFVNSYMRRSKKFEILAENQVLLRQKYNDSGKTIIDHQPLLQPGEIDGTNLLTRKKCEFAAKSLTIDKTCRIVFPALFIFFNTFYWLFYIKF